MQKILIIEDEKILGEMYEGKLTQTGYEVFWAGSAEDGIEAVPKIKPDLILLDILLPRANGIGFMGWLKKNKDFSSTPVVVFSNYDDPKTKKEAEEMGIKEYLIKTNHTPQQIIEKIKNYLE